MLKKHQNYTFIKNRLKQIWFEKKHPNAPWLTQDAVSLLNQLVKKNDIGLEFGSGRSTKWFAKRCGYLYSVENNKDWFDTVSEEIKNFDNVEYFFLSIDKSNPENSKYLSVLKEIEDNALDFVLNDGKIREHVALNSVKKLKIGGLIILDNAERYMSNSFPLPASIGPNENNMNYEWMKFKKMTDAWRKIWTTNGVSSTLILFKP